MTHDILQSSNTDETFLYIGSQPESSRRQLFVVEKNRPAGMITINDLKTFISLNLELESVGG